MKTFEKQAAQGDLLIRRVKHVPRAAKRADPEGNQHVVAHSETGHHHSIVADGVAVFRVPDDPMICYLRCESPVVLEHHRPWDTHEALQIPAGTFELRRQREYTPEGWRRVED